MYRKHVMINLSNKERKIKMMFLDLLVLTVKDEDGVFVNRHLNNVYVNIKATTITISNKHKLLDTYNLDDVVYMQTLGHPRHFKMFQ